MLDVFGKAQPFTMTPALQIIEPTRGY